MMMMMMMMRQKKEKQIRLTQIFSGTPEEAARCCGVAGFDIVHNKEIYNAIRCVSNQHTQVSRFSAIRRSDANAEWFTTRCAAKLWWRLWWQLRWQLRWQRCECSTTTAAAAYAVVLSQRHLPHDVAPEARRRRHEVSHDVNEAASKTKCRKSVMVMVIVWVWVWVSVGCCCCWARDTKSVCSMRGHYWVVLYGSNGCLPFPSLSPLPRVDGKMLRRKKNL